MNDTRTGILDKSRRAGVPTHSGKVSVKGMASPALAEATLDDIQDPETTFHIFDADAGQRLCLAAAAQGHSFVMLGPSGSGKKQTIANIIAESMARGKRILVVGDDNAALEAVAEKLRQAGLASCFENAAPVARPLLDAAEVDFARLKELRERLASHPLDMHAPRKPLGRSLWSVVAELTALRDLPLYPLGLASSRAGLESTDQLVVVTEAGTGWLDEATQAIKRLQQLWPLRGRQEFPWRGFKAERYNKQVRDEVTAVIDRVRSRLDRLLTAGGQYAAQLGYEGPIRSLLKAGELLEAAPPDLPEHWLTVNPAEIARALEMGAEEYQRLGQAREPLTARYGPGIWNLPDGTAASVERAWQTAAPLLPPGDDRGGGLLGHQQALRGWAADTQRRIPGWLTEARVLEKWLALALPRGHGADPDKNKDDPAPLHLRHLQRLANLCMSDHPPERAWVHSPKALEDTRAVIAAAKPKFADYHQRRRKLLETYKENLFDLDIPRLAAAFAGPYQAWWRVLRRQFRHDRRALRRRTHALAVPPTMAEDMAAANELLVSRSALEADAPARQAALGRYEKGLDTNLEACDRAARIAAEAVELVQQLGYTTLPPRFLDVLCAGGAPPEKIRAAAKRLHDSLGAWLHSTQELKAYLPLESMPETGGPLEGAALSALNRYAHDLQAALNQFAAVTDPVLKHAPAAPPDAATLVADLRQADEVRLFESSHAAETPRWQTRLGARFQGSATNWDILRKHLAWTRSVHDFFHGPAPERFRQLACGGAGKPPRHDLRAALEQYEQALHGFEARFDAPGPVHDGKRPAEQPPETVKHWLALLRERVADLESWIDLRHLPVRLGNLGLGVFWEELKRNPPPVEHMLDIFRKAFWSCWLEATLQQDPARFERAEHEKARAEFRRLDRDWLRHNARRILERVARAATDSPPCRFCSAAEAALLPDGEHFDQLIFVDADRIDLEEGMEAISHGEQLIFSGNHTRTPNAAPNKQTTSQNLLEQCDSFGLPTYRLRTRHQVPSGALAALDDAADAGPVEQDIVKELGARGYTAKTAARYGDLVTDLAVFHRARPEQCPLIIELDGPHYAATPTVRERECLHAEFLERHGFEVHRLWGLDWLWRREAEIDRLLHILEAEPRSI